ncbi:glycosyltransferase family 2 protein [Desulfotomaculum copahuensis]|uniref:glycosyltransferase family 2 protein n=1 Tax=Desulfotomaculum copahuensis TaxID=1838280 RepID=UPI000A90B1B5|nr:glycosyltransferase family 2 protein [Desulfotomaculum copahuensis]
MSHKVSVIILNWNGCEDTIECLTSLQKCDLRNIQVILIDNGSEDSSVEKVLAWANKSHVSTLDIDHKYAVNQETDFRCFHNSKLIIIKSKKNLGFAEGNNVGIRFALKVSKPDYLLLLNNDTVVDANFLKRLINAFTVFPNAGFAGPKVYYYDYFGQKNVIDSAGGKIDFWTGRAFNLMSRTIDQRDDEQYKIVDFIQGSCILLQVKVIQEIGLLDQQYFAYWEECDWCIRAKRKGYISVYVPTSMIWHKIAASNKGSKNIYWLIRNRFIFMKKNANTFQLVTFYIFFWLVHFWIQALGFLVKKETDKLSSYFKGLIEGQKIFFFRL